MMKRLMNSGKGRPVTGWRPGSPSGALRKHWPEYVMEAAQLAIFMVSAGVFTVIFDYPGSAVHHLVASPAVRRAMVGLAMGGTAMGLIYSPWGRRSGAHMNPAITLTYLRLGKIPLWDATFYCSFQFAGGLTGVILTALMLKGVFTFPPINYIVTVPGPSGVLAAFTGELVISIILMVTILFVSNRAAIRRFTGLVAGLLIAGFVTFEAPFSGFGMNPARTLSSTLPSGIRTALWIYFVAPPLGMLLAAEGYSVVRGRKSVQCCKLSHREEDACIFCGQSAR
jgi:aquaporin Z